MDFFALMHIIFAAIIIYFIFRRKGSSRTKSVSTQRADSEARIIRETQEAVKQLEEVRAKMRAQTNRSQQQIRSVEDKLSKKFDKAQFDATKLEHKNSYTVADLAYEKYKLARDTKKALTSLIDSSFASKDHIDYLRDIRRKIQPEIEGYKKEVRTLNNQTHSLKVLLCTKFGTRGERWCDENPHRRPSYLAK